MYGVDYEGNVCGQDDFESRDHIIYPRTNEDILVNYDKDISEYRFYGVCVEECPQSSDRVICNYEYDLEGERSRLCPLSFSTSRYDLSISRNAKRTIN